MTIKNNSNLISVLLPSLSGGGVASSLLKIAESLHLHGYNVEVIIAKPKKKCTIDVPKNVRIHYLKRTNRWISRIYTLLLDPKHLGSWIAPIALPLHIDGNIRALPNLVRYIKQKEPKVLLSGPTYANIVALMAKHISKVATSTIITEHINLSNEIADKSNKWQWRYILPLIRKLYPSANHIVAVSNGVKDNLVLNTNLKEHHINTIYNPVITNKVNELSRAPVSHEWLLDSYRPTILGIGRLSPQKDWPTLLYAFAKVRETIDTKLIILGEGYLREYLANIATQLGIREHFDMPGYVINPYAYMARADVTALSSKYEGLGNVLIEALACGCPVVSTNCPDGPAEILENGKYGYLVTVGDSHSLADAIIKSLKEKNNTMLLKNRGFEFTVNRSYYKYKKLIDNEIYNI